MTLPLHERSASSLAAGVATGELTPTAILEAHLERIHAVDPRVRAWSRLDEAGAREQAQRLTAEAAAGRLRGPLHGVPVGIKEQFHVAGLPTAPRGEGAPPEPADATTVARLRGAGAIILGKLHMPLEGVPPPTRNPWNLAHTPGGSSSGPGAAVAARMVPLALGEQTAGSGLRPAAYCGVAALKPTFGVLSRTGCHPLSWTFDYPTVIGREMRDVTLALSVMAGPDPADEETLRWPAPPPGLGDPRPPRLGLVEGFFDHLLEPGMRDALADAAARLERAGAEVRTVRLPPEHGLLTHVHDLVCRPEGATLRPLSRGGEAPTRNQLRDRLATLIPATYYLHAQRVRKRLVDDHRSWFAGTDALLMAVAPGTAPRGLASTGSSALLVPWSALGVPAITVSAGLDAGGLPLGLQLVGRLGDDHALCAAAAWCEDALGVLPAPPC